MFPQKLILSYSTKIIIQFIQIAASIVVARVAGPTVLGTVAFGLAYVTMFQFFAGLGLGTAHIKLVSEGKDIGKCIATYTRLKFVTIGLYFIIVLSFFLSQKYIFNFQFESITHQYVIIIFLVMATIQSFFAIPNMTFAGRMEQAKQDIPEIIRTVVLQVLRIIVVLLGYRALTLAFCNLVSAIFIIPVIWYLFKDYPFGDYDKVLAKQYIKIALPMIILGISRTLVQTLDKVFLQFLTNSEQVGYYTAGYRIGGFILIIANSVGMLFFPLFSQAVANGKYNIVKTKIEKFERFSLLFIMPSVIFLAIYSDSIVKFVLGNQYLPSINILSITTVSMFTMVLNIPYGNVLTGMGFFKLVAVINLINVIVIILALIVFIHPNLLALNATGAALAIMVSNIFLGMTYRFYAKQKLNILMITKNFKFIFFGVINFLIFFLFYGYFKELGGIFFRLVFPIIYFVFTYLTFILLKWVVKDDWMMLCSLVDIKSMKKYIASEIKFKGNNGI